ncbi:hypothetical protein Tco_0987130 [Tanacetum coccineum]
MVNDPLYLASSDHPGMMLTNTPFNGGNFLGWSRTIKMALGAKLKLGFIDGSSPKPAVIDVDYKRWVRCDYMVTCWILNSMVAELSESFLYAQSARDLWKELEERYCQSNGPLIYHVERELSKVTQGNSTIAAYFNKLKKFWDELHSLNEMMKMFTCKGIDPSYIDSTSQPHADLRVYWIVDTGASDHMSPHLHLFHSIRVLKKPIKIRLPGGTSKWVDKLEKGTTTYTSASLLQTLLLVDPT